MNNNPIVRTTYILLLGLLLMLCQCKTSQLTLLNTQVQHILDSMKHELDVPGISCALVDPQGKELTFTSGWSDVEEQTDLEADHVLMSGSIGKTYVAAVAFKLIEEGQLSLSDSLKRFLGDFQYFDKIPNAPLLTIDHLMTHTSGLTRYIMKPDIWNLISSDPFRIWTNEERLSFVLGDDPQHAPGEGWAYSDTNYILLGMVLEEITGKPYTDLVKDLILEPHALRETHVNDGPKIPNLSAAYSGLSEAFKIKPKVAISGEYTFNPQVEWTGGGMSSTTRDLARWIYRLHSGEVLTGPSYRIMVEPVPFERQLPDGSKYGYGCIIWKSDDGTYFGHSGIMPGFLSLAQYAPEYKYSLAIQVNKDLLPRGKSLNEIALLVHSLYQSHLNIL